MVIVNKSPFSILSTKSYKFMLNELIEHGYVCDFCYRSDFLEQKAKSSETEPLGKKIQLRLLNIYLSTHNQGDNHEISRIY